MNRISNDLRKVFLSQYKLGKKPKEIATILSISVQTITSWIRLVKKHGEENIIKVNKPLSYKRKYSESELREIFTNNPYALNKKLGAILGLSAVSIHRYRVQYGFTYKSSTKSYKEANPVVKKNSQMI